MRRLRLTEMYGWLQPTFEVHGADIDLNCILLLARHHVPHHALDIHHGLFVVVTKNNVVGLELEPD